MTYAAEIMPEWTHALHLIKDHSYVYRDEPFKLASGRYSNDYIDAKLAINTGERLRVVSAAIIELASLRGMSFTHVGGLTMGADPLAHGIAMLTGCGWFSVRKEPKQRGREQWIEGSPLGPGNRILIVDDVVTTGGSAMKAYEHVRDTAADVIGVIPMVDRGEVAGRLFEHLGVAYAPLVTYKDIGIEPIGPA